MVLPDSEANGPDPAPGGLTGGGLTDGQDSLSSRQEQEQPDDPEPVKQPQEEPEEDSQTGASEQSAALVFTWPVKGEVLRDFSAETLALDPTLEDWRTHMGVDIAASLGVEVLAIASGTVSAVYEDGLMGTTVVVDHGNGLVTTYSNLAGQPTVESGDTVETGTILGTVAEHCHRRERPVLPPAPGGQPQRRAGGPHGISAPVRGKMTRRSRRKPGRRAFFF